MGPTDLVWTGIHGDGGKEGRAEFQHPLSPCQKKSRPNDPPASVRSLPLFNFPLKRSSAWAPRQRIVTPTSAFRRRPTLTPNKATRSTQGRRQSRRSIDYSDIGEVTLCHDDTDDGEDEADPEQYLFPWDNESTMFSDLIDDA